MEEEEIEEEEKEEDDEQDEEMEEEDFQRRWSVCSQYTSLPGKPSAFHVSISLSLDMNRRTSKRSTPRNSVQCASVAWRWSSGSDGRYAMNPAASSESSGSAVLEGHENEHSNRDRTCPHDSGGMLMQTR